MASLSDLLLRTDFLLKKYEKYDVQLEPLQPVRKGADAFEDEVIGIEMEIEKLQKQAEEVSKLQNRATVAAKNAEIRRSKSNLINKRIEEMKKKYLKGKGNEDKIKVIQKLIDDINAIPDGVKARPSQYRIGGGAGVSGETSVSTSAFASKYKQSGSGYLTIEKNEIIRPEEYQHTEETRQFESDWKVAKARQDEALDRIEHGVGVLGQLARDMDQEIQIQNPVMDAMEEKAIKVKENISTRNAQLKGTLSKMRSARNLCFDIFLIIILLALAAYIYSILK